jgi:hypothetical protein
MTLFPDLHYCEIWDYRRDSYELSDFRPKHSQFSASPHSAKHRNAVLLKHILSVRLSIYTAQKNSVSNKHCKSLLH